MVRFVSPRPSRLGAVAAVGVVILALSGCAAAELPDPGFVASPPTPRPPAGEVLAAQGTVIQVDDTDPELCLGPVLESYPIQCSGDPIDGWEWFETDNSLEADGTRWGSFALSVTWDGARFALVNDPIPLALYDPIAPEPDPMLDTDQPGPLSESQIESITTEIDEVLGGNTASYGYNGYVFVQVMYDDGSLQQWMTDIFGAGRIGVRSVLVPVDELPGASDAGLDTGIDELEG